MPAKDPCALVPRRRTYFITTIILISYFGLGLVRGQEGVVFLDLCLLLSIDIERGSLLFLLSSLGYMLGSLGAGVLSDRTNPRVVYACSLLGAGGLSFLVPFCRNLPLMSLSMFLRSLFAGGVGTVATFICVKLWREKANTVLQILHFNFAIGALVIPLITEPFLAKKHVNAVDAFNTSLDVPMKNMTKPQLESVNASHYNDTQDPRESYSFHSPNTNVYVSFVITGAYLLFVSVPFWVDILNNRLEKVSLIRKQTKRAHRSICSGCSKDQLETLLTKHVCSRAMLLEFAIVALIFVLYMSYGCIEKGFATFLMPFAVDFLQMSKTDAAYLTSVFWGSFAASRGLGILGSKLLDEFKMLLLLYVLLLLGFCLLFLNNIGSMAPIWVASVVTGLGMAGIFPTAASWINAKLKPVTGFVSAILSISSSLGTMFNIPLLGFLLERISPMWFIYLGLIYTVLCCVAFVALNLISHRNRHLNNETQISLNEDHEEIKTPLSH